MAFCNEPSNECMRQKCLATVGEAMTKLMYKGREPVVKVGRGGLIHLNAHCDKSYAVGISPQHT